MTTDAFRAVWGKIDPNRRVNSFEVYGFDFMLDDDFKVYLIEVNNNPSLSIQSSSHLSTVIPAMLQNAMRIVLDPLFPTQEQNFVLKNTQIDICPENKFELIFDESIDGPKLAELYKEKEEGTNSMKDKLLETEVSTAQPPALEILVENVDYQ